MIAVTCCPGWLPAADVVVLTDGDRLTGTVQKLEKGKLFFKIKHSETPLQIDWTLVSGVTTESELKMTQRDGTQETGTLLTSAAGLSFVAAGAVTAIRPSAVVSLEPKAQEQPKKPSGWFRRAWANTSLSEDFGQSYSGLAHYNQLSSTTEVNYQGERWDGTLVTHYDYYGATDSAGSTYQAYGRLLADRYIGGDHFFLFPYAFLGRQTTADGGRGQLRQFGGGAGWTFRRQKSDQVSFFAGLVRSTGNGFTILNEDVRLDGRYRDTLSIFAITWDKTLRFKIATSVRLYYFKPILEAGHHGMAADANAKIPLFGPAYLTFRAYDTPELRQRQLFSTKNLQLSSGIGIEF